MQGKRILIVDDDPALVKLLERAFVSAGAEVYTAEDGEAGLARFFAHQPDLVILDILMPVLNGWETCARMKLFSDVPIILLTSLSEERDIIRGLESCSADYVTKPFSVKLLLARTMAVLREAETASARKVIAAYDNGYLRLDQETRQVEVRARPVDLTNTEYRLLVYLYRNAGRVVNYEQILAAVWGREYRDQTSYVHNYVSRLRQKLEPDPKNPEYLLTEHAVGYKFRKPSPP
jgi:two-component system KDP operon response regulator KdpE